MRRGWEVIGGCACTKPKFGMKEWFCSIHGLMTLERAKAIKLAQLERFRKAGLAAREPEERV